MGSGPETTPGFQAAQLAGAEVCNCPSGRKLDFSEFGLGRICDYKDYDFDFGLPGLRIRISSENFGTSQMIVFFVIM